MKKTAYIVEKERQLYARGSNLKKLKGMYSDKFLTIEDLNKPKFWDERYANKNQLSYQDSMTRARINEVKNLIPDDKKIILDIGAGLGWVEELLDNSKKVYANDFSSEAVDYLKKNFKGIFKIQSIYNLKYKENFFDVILLLEVLEHIPPSKLFKVLDSVRKLLKEDGILIVSVPMNEGLEDMKVNLNGHVRMYTEDLIKSELRIAGFEVVECKTFFAFKNLYFIKSLIATIFKTHHNNNIVLKAKKI